MHWTVVERGQPRRLPNCVCVQTFVKIYPEANGRYMEFKKNRLLCEVEEDVESSTLALPLARKDV